MRKIACYADASPFICNSNHMPSPGNRCVTDFHWHFNSRPINCHFAVREHLELMATRDDSQALFDRASSHGMIVVNNDAECTTDEVSHQQVRTVTSKLKEATIKCHEMLGTSQAGMTCII